MTVSRYAKAIAAFAVAPPTLLIAAFACGVTDPRHYAGVFLMALVSGAASGLAAYLVPNRTHGFNVNDIADVLIQSGLDAVAQYEDFQDE